MEHSPNIDTQPISRRFRLRVMKMAGYALGLVDREPDTWKPSAQIDVGKTAAEAAGVQLIIQGLSEQRDVVA